MDHHAFIRFTRRRAYTPCLSCGCHKHLTSRRAGLTQHLPRAAHAEAPARSLASVFRRMSVRLFDAHFAPVGIKLLCNDHRQRCAHTLAHLGLGDGNGHRAGRLDLDKRVGSKVGCGSEPVFFRGKVKTQHEARTGNGRNFEKISSIQVRVHGFSPCPLVRWRCPTFFFCVGLEATWIAFRIRLYVPHRQMSSMDALISSSLGFAF